MTNLFHFQSLSNSDMMPVNGSKKVVELTSNLSQFEANDVTLTALALENIVNNTAVLNEVCDIPVTLFLSMLDHALSTDVNKLLIVTNG